MKLKEAIRVLKNHNCWRKWIMWYAMTTPKKLWIAIDMIVNEYETNLDEEMLNVSVKELQFANLQKQHLQSILNEVSVLLMKWAKKELINKVIDNWIQRWMRDLSIHYDTMCGWIDNSSLNKCYEIK